MNLNDVIRLVAKGYEAIEEEDRAMIVHLLRDDNGMWDMSPAITFPCGKRPSDLEPLLSMLMHISGSEAIVAVNDSWTYPESMQKQLSRMSRKEFEDYYAEHPPSSHADRVNCAMYLAASKRGDFAFAFQNRGGELRIGSEDEVQSFGGRQVVAIKNIVGIS